MPKAKPQTKPPVKRKAGRPKAEIDWAQVGKLLEAGATAEGVAAVIGIHRNVLYDRCQKDNKIDFSAFSQEKKSKGDEQLRVKQYQTAMGGNVVMQIWLGKQRLGQSDKTQNEHSGPGGGPIQTENKHDLSKLDTDDLVKLKEINKKLAT